MAICILFKNSFQIRYIQSCYSKGPGLIDLPPSQRSYQTLGVNIFGHHSAHFVSVVMNVSGDRQLAMDEFNFGKRAALTEQHFVLSLHVISPQFLSKLDTCALHWVMVPVVRP